jgi:coiled-coil domain-containing protein 12
LNVRTDNAIARLVRERIRGAAAKKQGEGSQSQQLDGDTVELDGVALVEGLRTREREEEEAERREKEDESSSAL